MSTLGAIVRKDLLLFRSDRRALLMQVAAPILISAFFGFVFSGSREDAESARIAVLVADEDDSETSRAIVEGLGAEKMLDVKPAASDAAREQVRQGRAAVALVIPAGFGAAARGALFAPGDKPQVPLLYDPSHAAERAVVGGLLTQHVMRTVSRQAFSQAPSLPYVVREEAIIAGAQVAYNGFAHAFAGMSVQFILFSGINLGVALLLDRQRGVWKRLRAAPLSKRFVLGARTLSGALVAFLTLAIVFGAAILLFGVRVQGSWIGFVGVLAGIALMSSTFGLLIAAIGKTPEATRGVSIFAVLIMVMLGGAWVPTFLFPAWLQRFTLVVPARWAVDGIEAMTWRGLPLEAALPTIGMLLAFALLFGILALLRFRWEAD